MNKIAIICIFAVLLGSTTPIYAADSNTSNSAQQQVQATNPQLFQDLNDLYNQITQNPGQITNLLQNVDVQNQIHQALQNPTVQNDFNILLQNKDIKNDLNKIMNNS